jgi:spore maturation protein CgeB
MSQGARIAFFGSSLVSAYWNGAATYYRGITKALHSLGHTVVFFEPDAFGRQQHRDIPDPPYAESVVYPADMEGVRQVLARAERSDVVIKASGVGVFDDLLEKSVLDLKAANRRVFFWDVDAPATLERMTNDLNDPFRDLVPEYDLILAYGGGDPVINGYRSFGARRCIPIYNALDPDTHFPVEHDERFEGSLGFLGNRMPDRETRVWEFFFRPASMLADERFLLGGSGWEEHVPDLANIRYLGHVYTRDHNAFYCSPRAALNVSRESMARFGFSPATRVFEAAGAGACVITDAWEGVELFLEPERECLVARDGAEVAGVLSALDDDRARRIGSAARERMLSEHTYQHRARHLESLLTSSPETTVKAEP